MHHARVLPAAFVAAFLVIASSLATAQTTDYLRANTAIGYEVDPHWPKRPSSVAPWGHMPGVAVDADDRIWTFNRGEDPVQVYSADGKFIRTWGRGSLGLAHHLKIDADGNVWLSDIGRHVVEKYTPAGERLLTIGTPDQAGESETKLNKPTDMAIAANGDVFISDGYGNNRVVHVDRNGKFVKSWGKLGTAPGDFNLPHAIAIDSKGRLYVADRNNVRIQVFDQSGKLLDVWSDLVVPWGFCMTDGDDLWVCGSSPMRWWTPSQYTIPLGCPPKDQVFMRFSTDGRLRQLWTVPKALDGFERPGECNWVHGIAVDSRGNLYVGDILGQRIQKFVRVAPDTDRTPTTARSMQ
ncbi:MAG TPA: peptidyl-alpha-hydroxyglycine alpha-amidating lyase family protein [Pirellulales bacterium]|nr:peptidyl-alpha-hydroxyglycine alpha-amidating lyase family protein [Pirellulales bacterium]